MEQIILKFTGDLAEQHQLPAYEGTSSLEGIARTLTIISNYLVTGEIRIRYPFSPQGRVILQATQQGSFESIFQLATDPELTKAIFHDIAVSVAEGFAAATIKHVFHKIIGHDSTPKSEFVKELENRRGGELDALADASEPALKKGHTIIGHGAETICFISGHNNNVTFDSRSKRYLTEIDRDNRLKTKRISVVMLDVNAGYGRVYGRVFDYELDKTVPFQIARHATPRTREKLASSLKKYAAQRTLILNKKSGVYMKFTEGRDIDGRVKRYYIEDAWFGNDNATQGRLGHPSHG